MKYIAGIIAAGLLFCVVYFGYYFYFGQYWPVTWWWPIGIGTLIGRVYAGVKISTHLEHQKQLQLFQLKQIEAAKRAERKKMDSQNQPIKELKGE